MSDRVRLLLIDDDAHDRALALLVLSQGLGDTAVEEVAGPVAFAEHLAAGGFAAAIVSGDLAWGDGTEVIRAIHRRYPQCAVFLLLRPGASIDAAMVDSLGLAGVLGKNSAGFLELPRRIHAVLTGPETQPDAAAEPFQALLQEIPLAIFTLTGDGRIAYANPAMGRLLGSAESAAGLKGKPLDGFLLDRALARRLRTLQQQGRRIDGAQLRVRGLDAEARWASLCAWSSTDSSGRPSVHGVLRDIARTHEIAAELTRRTEELQELASAVSHDLMGVIRIVREYARLLIEQYSGRLDDDAERYLNHLDNASERLETMVDAVLEYLHSDQDDGRSEPVDFDKVVEEAVANLGPVVDQTGATVKHGPLPTLPAHRRLMVQVFQNLIDNALKFSGDAPPRILVSSRERELYWEFAIKDNGIGVDPENQDRIFGMFRRLHAREDYPGSGMGLALCRRIVERHGGRIWVKSKAGHGATFLFTLPKSAADSQEAGRDTDE